MAFELGAIIARIKADTTDFERGIDSAKSKIGSLNDGVQKAAGYSQTFATGLLAVGTALGAATGFAIKSAAGIEQTRASFETMLGSGEKAGALMKELNEFAASTPFEFPELAEAGKKMLAYGFSADEVKPKLRELGDISAALNVPIGELSELYGKARVQGRMYAEDYNQFMGRGIPLGRELAKIMGVNEQEVKKLVEEGKIGFPEVEKAIANMTAEGSQFGGGMARQATTVNGMISTLKDTVGAFARELVGMNVDGTVIDGSIFDRGRKALGAMLEWLDANKENIKNGLATILNFIKDNAPIVVGVIVGLLIPALIAMGVAVWGAVSGFVVAMAPFVAIGVALGLAFMALRPHFDTIAEVINTKLKPAFDQFMGVLRTIFETVWPIILGAFNALMPSLQALGDTIVNRLWPALQSIFQALQALWGFISPILIPILIAVAAVIGAVLFGAIWLVINVINILITVGSWLANAFVAYINILVSWWHVLWAVVQAVFSGIWHIVSAVINAIVAHFQGFFNIIKTIFQTIINVARQLFQGDLQGAFRAAIDGVKAIWGSIGAWFKGIWDGIIRGLSGIGEGIVKPFREAIDKIKGLVNGAKDALNKLNPFSRNSPSLVDWVTKGTRVIADQYDRMSNSIAAGTNAARQQTLGTSRTLANVSSAELAARGGEGAGRGAITINVEGVLADSPEAKRKFGVELVTLINDDLSARGAGVIPT